VQKAISLTIRAPFFFEPLEQQNSNAISQVLARGAPNKALVSRTYESGGQNPFPQINYAAPVSSFCEKYCLQNELWQEKNLELRQFLGRGPRVVKVNNLLCNKNLRRTHCLTVKVFQSAQNDLAACAAHQRCWHALVLADRHAAAG
jgi:hypothetical protein